MAGFMAHKRKKSHSQKQSYSQVFPRVLQLGDDIAEQFVMNVFEIVKELVNVDSLKNNDELLDILSLLGTIDVSLDAIKVDSTFFERCCLFIYQNKSKLSGRKTFNEFFRGIYKDMWKEFNRKFDENKFIIFYEQQFFEILSRNTVQFLNKSGFSFKYLVAYDDVIERIKTSELENYGFRSFMESNVVLDNCQGFITEPLIHPCFECISILDSLGQNFILGKNRTFTEEFTNNFRSKIRKSCRIWFNNHIDDVLEIILKSPRYKKQYDNNIIQTQSVFSVIPLNPIDAFPVARHMKRHFVIHSGPTNSGKTHDALQALAVASSGVYLGPLRLLAYEKYLELNEQGCLTTLLTGEEKIETDEASHFSSTVEMVDLETVIDVVVIDEAQMIADSSRGEHWTTAILGVPAHVVHVCCAPYATKLIQQLVDLCGDTYEVVNHERLVPLEERHIKNFKLKRDVKKGDALIVFSRRNVHAVAAELQEAGYKVSMIYGALPPDVRRESARRFADGETDIVVATDAIGMGMNLPIRRVILLQSEKFDGYEQRLLQPTEVQQIVGRAGRFGKYDIGLWSAVSDSKEMHYAAVDEIDDISNATLSIPEILTRIEGMPLSLAVNIWSKNEPPKPFEKIMSDDALYLINLCERMIDKSEWANLEIKRKIYSLATLPFNTESDDLLYLWNTMASSVLKGTDFKLSLSKRLNELDMKGLEFEYQWCDLLYAFCRKFGYDEYLDVLMKHRNKISERLMELVDKSAEGKHCSRCGCKLPWNYTYGMCHNCYEEQFAYREYYYFY